MNNKRRNVRGVRSPAPPGHVVGNLDGRETDAYWVDLYSLSTAVSNILTGGTGQGQGGGFGGGIVRRLQPLDDFLTSLSGLTTIGIVVRSDDDPETAVTRTLVAGTGISIANPAGIAGDITITNTAPSSGGTVTSVALSMPTSVFDVSGSPITTSGTFAVTFDTQTANTVFAGPTSGGAATPAFRALVALDIPTLLSSKISDFTEAAQDATGAMVDSTLVYVDATPLLTRAALTGDVTAPQASNATTLATVNANVGSFGSATQVAQVTANAKGLMTAVANVTIAVPSTAVTDFTEAAQDATGAMATDGSLVYVDATPLLTRGALTGDVTAAQGSNATTIANDAVTFAKMQNITTNRLLGRDTPATGDVEQIALGGHLSFDGSLNLVTALSTAPRLLGRTTAGAGVTEEISAGTGLSLSALTIDRAALTGDITASAGSNATTLATVNANVGTFGSATQVAQVTENAKGLTTAVSNVAIAIPSTAVTDFTEAAQDATGAMVDSTLVYVDATPLLTRAALTGDVTAPQASNATTLATVNANVGSFGSATQVMTQTVNAKGLTTAAANVSIAIPSTQVTDFTEAAQDAAGAMVGPSLVYVDATPLLARAALTGDITAPQDSNATTLATVNANVGSFGSATQVMTQTVNAKGLTTAAANVTIAIPSTAVTDFTEAVQDVVGAFATDTATIDVVYTDASNIIEWNVKAGSITAAMLVDDYVSQTDTATQTMVGDLTISKTGGGATQFLVQGEGSTRHILGSYAASNATQIRQRRASGTIATPAAIPTGQLYGQNLFQGYGTTDFVSAGSFNFVCTEPVPSDSLMGARFVMEMCPVGSATLTEMYRMEHASGFSMFGANPVIDQNRTLRTRVYTTASPPTNVQGGLTFDSTYNAPVYGGLTTTRTVARGHPITTSPTADRLINRLSVAPSAKLERLIRDTFDRLRVAGLLTSMKGLYVLADPHSEFAQADAQINWITPGTGDLVVSGTVTYTAGQGIAGNGSTGILSTGQTQATFGLLLDNCAWGVDIRTANTSALPMVGQTSGNRRALMTIGNTSTVTSRVSASNNDTFTPAAYTGFFQLWRTASTGYQWSLNGAAGATLTETSTTIVGTLSFLATTDNTASAFSDGQIRLAFLGIDWTDAKTAALYSIMQFWWGAAAGLTVARLPTVASLGDMLIATDALAPTFLATVVGGGAVITPVFYNGTNWVGY